MIALCFCFLFFLAARDAWKLSGERGGGRRGKNIVVVTSRISRDPVLRADARSFHLEMYNTPFGPRETDNFPACPRGHRLYFPMFLFLLGRGLPRKSRIGQSSERARNRAGFSRRLFFEYKKGRTFQFRIKGDWRVCLSLGEIISRFTKYHDSFPVTIMFAHLHRHYSSCVK